MVELIEGVVFMPSPVRFESHDWQASLLRGWLFTYSNLHDGLESGNEATLIGNSEVQPDAFLMRVGAVPTDEEGYLRGAPQLVAGVAASTASRDLHSKLALYERNGVREYIVAHPRWRHRLVRTPEAVHSNARGPTSAASSRVSSSPAS